MPSTWIVGATKMLGVSRGIRRPLSEAGQYYLYDG
jgi:hypothetical protein